MKRLLCWLLGHPWIVHASSYRAIILAHASPIAGCCVECLRCGERRCDIPQSAQLQGETHDCEKDRKTNE